MTILNLSVIILQKSLLINESLFSFLWKLFQIEKWLEREFILRNFRMHNIISNSMRNCAVEPSVNQVNIHIFFLRVDRSTVLLIIQMLLIYCGNHRNGQLNIVLIPTCFDSLVLRVLTTCFVYVYEILTKFHVLILILHKLIFKFN